jgi:HD containing hydrolase-like enzyme
MKKETLYAGTGVAPHKLEEDDVHTLDIAFGLAGAIRFGGHNMKPKTVLQHSLDVHDIVLGMTTDKDILLTALLHDASEAYISDIPSPLKAMLPGYKELEKHVQRTVLNAYEVKHADTYSDVLPFEVKYADQLTLEREWNEGIEKSRLNVGYIEVPEPCYSDTDKLVASLSMKHEIELRSEKISSSIIRFVQLIKLYYNEKL